MAVIAIVAISVAHSVTGAADAVSGFANNVVASVKFTSHAQLKASRGDGWVSFTAIATRKTPWSDWTAWPGATVNIQRLSGGAWKTIKTAKADSDGKIHFRLKAGAASIYRSFVDASLLTLQDDSPRMKT